MKILLTGTYCSKNKGDATMQQVFATKLRSYEPDVEVSIASPFPELDSRYYKVQVIRSRRRNLPLATLHWLLLEIFRIFGYQLRKYPLNKEIDAMTQADLVVDLSGDMLTEDYGPLVGYSHFLPLLQAQALKRPTVICAQSIGPFHRLKLLAQRILSRAELITVRESLSIRLIKDLGHLDIEPHLTADLAFLLQPATPERVSALLAAEDILPATKPRIGISVSALLANRANRYIATSKGDKLEVFAGALDYITKQFDVEILLVPHVFGPRESSDDRQVCDKLASLMRYPPLQLHGEYRPEEIKGVIARCDAFVGCRMHANIAALDSGVPVLAVGYSHKFRGILTDINLADWVLPLEDLTQERLIAHMSLLLTEAAHYQHLLKQELPVIRERAMKNIVEILSLVGRETKGYP